MRGQRDPLNENGDGEVDENFWAQAAADQAAGRATSDGEGGVLSHVFSRRVFLIPEDFSHASRRRKFNPVQHSVLPRRR